MEIVGAIQGLQAAKDILQALIALKIAGKFQAQLSEIQGHLVAANIAALNAFTEQEAMLKSVRELEAELLKFENWETEKERYELKEAAPDSKTFVYTIKESMQADEPPHSICPDCYEDRIKRILQTKRRGLPEYGGGNRLTCSRCSFDVSVPIT